MFAVIKTGGKQYRVSEGDELTIEKLAARAGDKVQFNDVLMLGGDETHIGAPYVEDAGVTAEVLDQIRGPKLINFKKRRRKHSSKRLKGHRQDLTTIRIGEILASGASASGIQAAFGAGKAPMPEAPAEAGSAPTKKGAKKISSPDMSADEPAKKSAQSAAKPPKSAEKAAKAAAEAATRAPEDAAKPANLLEGPQGDADDLTKMSGVGPKLRDKLNANGVFHFWQIAAWGPAEIAYMDEQLDFKGRIERDDWVSQAQTLAAEQR